MTTSSSSLTSTVHYFYFYVPEENLHAVMIQSERSEGVFSIRPVSAYYQEKTAKAYVKKVNERIAAKKRGEKPDIIRTNPPISYFRVPEWWTDRFPDRSHMHQAIF